VCLCAPAHPGRTAVSRLCTRYYYAAMAGAMPIAQPLLRGPRTLWCLSSGAYCSTPARSPDGAGGAEHACGTAAARSACGTAAARSAVCVSSTQRQTCAHDRRLGGGGGMPRHAPPTPRASSPRLSCQLPALSVTIPPHTPELGRRGRSVSHPRGHQRMAAAVGGGGGGWWRRRRLVAAAGDGCGRRPTVPRGMRGGGGVATRSRHRGMRGGGGVATRSRHRA